MRVLTPFQVKGLPGICSQVHPRAHTQAGKAPLVPATNAHSIREMGGAPRNPAPSNHFLVWMVKPSGCHCTDGHLTSIFFRGSKDIVECRPLLGAPPLSLTAFLREDGNGASVFIYYILLYYIYIYILLLYKLLVYKYI